VGAEPFEALWWRVDGNAPSGTRRGTTKQGLAFDVNAATGSAGKGRAVFLSFQPTPTRSRGDAASDTEGCMLTFKARAESPRRRIER
jgi:hypothetical protein